MAKEFSRAPGRKPLSASSKRTRDESLVRLTKTLRHIGIFADHGGYGLKKYLVRIYLGDLAFKNKR